jgi:hypothetical protein
VYRQGDILLVPIEDVPQGVKPIEREGGRIVLAKGESTGHAHVVVEKAVKFVLSPTGKRILISRVPFTLRHEEHSTLRIPAGAFEVVRQREYTLRTIRLIAD